MSSAKCGIAIIGYGYMGMIRRRVVEQSLGLHLVGVAEVKPRPADLPAEVLWTASWAELIARDDVQAVFVCAPNALIPEVAVAALARGKHVFCEKPPGRTVDDVRRMQAAEKAAGRTLMFGFNHRFHPAMMEAKAIVDRGDLGRLLWLKGTYGKSGGQGFEESWRNDKAVSGGGILLDQGIHMIDLFRYYAGDFAAVKSFGSTVYWPIAVEDNAFVIFQGDERGPGRPAVNAMLHSSATLWKHTFRLELGLENGYLNIDGLLSRTGAYGRETLTVGRRQFEGQTRAVGNPEETRYYYDTDRSWQIEVENFARAIAGGAAPEQCSSHDALRAMELVHAAYADSAGA